MGVGPQHSFVKITSVVSATRHWYASEISMCSCFCCLHVLPLAKCSYMHSIIQTLSNSIVEPCYLSMVAWYDPLPFCMFNRKFPGGLSTRATWAKNQLGWILSMKYCRTRGIRSSTRRLWTGNDEFNLPVLILWNVRRFNQIIVSTICMNTISRCYVMLVSVWKRTALGILLSNRWHKVIGNLV